MDLALVNVNYNDQYLTFNDTRKLLKQKILLRILKYICFESVLTLKLQALQGQGRF